jgi:hypothetical protein
MKMSVRLSCLAVLMLASWSFASVAWTLATDSAGWSKRCGQGAVVFNNELWVMGGLDSVLSSSTKGHLFNDVWHSTDGTSWSLATDSAAWPRRVLPTCLVFGGKMWVIGGVTPGASPGTVTLANDVWSSTDGTQWTKATDSAGWHPRVGQAGVVFDSLMWVMGGADSFGPSGPTQKVNDVWNSSDGVNWTQVTSSAGWSPRDGHAAVVFAGKMWVIGGEVSHGDSTDVWYSTNGVAWTKATSQVVEGRAFFPVLPFEGNMWMTGGCGSFLPICGDVWRSADGSQWTEDTSHAPWRARYGHAAAYFNNRMWVLGGCDSTAPRHDVWCSEAAGVAEGRASFETRAAALGARPNPFCGRTELACARNAAGPASIWIQDVSGRQIRTLVADNRTLGLANVVWDGRDCAGKDVPAGVYFALVSAGGRTDETMVVKLR